MATKSRTKSKAKPSKKHEDIGDVHIKLPVPIPSADTMPSDPGDLPDYLGRLGLEIIRVSKLLQKNSKR